MELLAAFDVFKALLTLMMWGVVILLAIGLLQLILVSVGAIVYVVKENIGKEDENELD